MERSLRPLQAAYQLALAPPERLSWVEFAEKHMRLKARETATPGPLHLWATQRGIIDVINAGEHQFVTIMKAARAGITKAAILAHRTFRHCFGSSTLLSSRSAFTKWYFIENEPKPSNIHALMIWASMPSS